MRKLMLAVAVCAVVVMAGGVFAQERITVGDKTYNTRKNNHDNTTWFMEDLRNSNGGTDHSWYDAMRACPAGWRLPTELDWHGLFNLYLGYSEFMEEFIPKGFSREWWSSGERIEYDRWKDKWGRTQSKQRPTAVVFFPKDRGISCLGTHGALVTRSKDNSAKVRCVKDNP